MTGSARPVRVLWLIKQLGPGGAERLLINSAKRRDATSFDIEAAYVQRWNDTLVPDLEATGIAVRCLGVNSIFDLRWAWRLRKLIDARRYDIVHVHSPIVASVFRMLRLGWTHNRRPSLIVTEHASWHSYRLPTKIINTLTGHLDDYHLSVSAFVRNTLPSWLRRRSEILVQGVPVRELQGLRTQRDDVRSELGVGPDQVLVITVANLVVEKSYPDLLRAAATVIAHNSSVIFVAVGRGVLEDQLQRLHSELGLLDRFRFLGYRDDAVRLMAGADIFALASSVEGFPVAIMEVLSVGVPVVATSVGGIPDAVRDGIEGRLVPPHRPDLLAARILELAGDPAFRARAAAAAVARSAEFDIDRTVRATEAIYRHLVASRTSGVPSHGLGNAQRESPPNKGQ